MTDHWRRVVTLHFGGDRYGERALDVDAWAELQRFQSMVSETAKALWRDHNPNRARLPRNFEDKTRLWLRTIEDGSTVIPFEIPVDKSLVDAFPEATIHNEVTEAIDIVHQVFLAVNNNTQFPEECPKTLLSEYARLGESLNESCTLQFAPPKQIFARVTKCDRDRLALISESSYEDELDITGRVLEADVRQRKFQIWLDDRASVSASFTPLQETQVTSALKEHKSMRLRVRGRGIFAPDGKPRRITEVVSLHRVDNQGSTFDRDAPRVEDIVSSIFGEIPDSEWNRVPNDLSHRLDSYISEQDEQ